MNKKENINKESSPRNVVGDLRLIKSLYKKVFSLFNTTKSAEDSRQRHSGMTTLFNNGFTLIELLVVVLIIGILSAIALPQYQKAVYKARAVEAKVNLAAIANAQQAFYLANGYYTNDLELLDVGVKNTSSVSYYCNISTTPHNADCWARMSVLRYNFFVSPNSTTHYCVGEKNSLGESVCKGEGTYVFDTDEGDASYYQF